MTPARRSVALTLCVGLWAPSPLTAQAPRAKQPPKRAPAAQPGVIQPRPVALPVELCAGCQTTTRRRIAVMPVNVGVLASELRSNGDAIARRLRDRVEASIAQMRSLVVLNRSDLDAVLAEQTLAVQGITAPELAPERARLIPAQFLLFVTVDHIDLRTTRESVSSDETPNYVRQAELKDRDARNWRDRIAQLNNALRDQRAWAEEAGSNWNRIIAECSWLNIRDPAWAICWIRANAAQDVSNRAWAAVRATEQELANAQQAVIAVEDEAQQLRDKARFEAQRTREETRTSEADIELRWRVVDSSYGVVIASGSASASDSSVEQGATVQTPSASRETSVNVRYDALVNSLVGTAVQNLVSGLESRLAKQPFRAKVVIVRSDGVIINCGSNLGVSVGDTFGVRQRTEILTDPDTGLPLNAPGPPIGRIRVSEVFEQTALGQVIGDPVRLARGDELEWIGVYLGPGQTRPPEMQPQQSPSNDERPSVAPDNVLAKRVAPTVETGSPPALPFRSAFSINDEFGNRSVLEFTMADACTITAEASFAGTAPALALILNGPTRDEFDRKDGASPLRVSFRVSQATIQKGTHWRVSIVNFSRTGSAQGTVMVFASSCQV